MLVKCNSCSNEISSEAKTCPHCGKPDPYTDADARFDAAISKKVDRQMSRESNIMIVVAIIGALWGWFQGGGWLWMFVGLIIGVFVSQVINKVIGWFD